MRSFYQDRLGINIGKVEKRGVFRRARAHDDVCVWCGNVILRCQFYNFILKNPGVYQDRLGTNIVLGKVQKEERSILCFCRLSDSSLLAVLVGCDAALDSLGGAVHRVDDWCVVRTTSSLHLIPGPFRSA